MTNSVKVSPRQIVLEKQLFLINQSLILKIRDQNLENYKSKRNNSKKIYVLNNCYIVQIRVVTFNYIQATFFTFSFCLSNFLTHLILIIFQVVAYIFFLNEELLLYRIFCLNRSTLCWHICKSTMFDKFISNNFQIKWNCVRLSNTSCKFSFIQEHF